MVTTIPFIVDFHWFNIRNYESTNRKEPKLKTQGNQTSIKRLHNVRDRIPQTLPRVKENIIWLQVIPARLTPLLDSSSCHWLLPAEFQGGFYLKVHWPRNLFFSTVTLSSVKVPDKEQTRLRKNAITSSIVLSKPRKQCKAKQQEVPNWAAIAIPSGKWNCR